MRSSKIKFLSALFCFIVGFSAFYLRPIIPVHLFETKLSESELADKIEIRFVGFVQGEYESEAIFQITNKSAENVYYNAFGRENYAFPRLKRNGELVVDKRFRCGTGISEQKLIPGETVLFRVFEHDVDFEFVDNVNLKINEPTQIGFSFRLGEKHFIEIGSNHPGATLWSDEITF